MVSWVFPENHLIRNGPVHGGPIKECCARAKAAEHARKPVEGFEWSWDEVQSVITLIQIADILHEANAKGELMRYVWKIQDALEKLKGELGVNNIHWGFKQQKSDETAPYVPYEDILQAILNPGSIEATKFIRKIRMIDAKVRETIPLAP